MIEIPGYYLKRTIGTGGMATVYLAVQESLDREVALKVMTPVLAADETFAARFRREARTIGQLSHPNIVQIYDVGTTTDNHNYFSMQYLPGGTLKDRLSQPMEETEIYRIFTGVLKALGFAHDLGFVHRDVKPENILFDVAGTPILTDFGIARALRSSTRITQTGMSVGTSRYMSPEQARGGTVDARSDLYAMGVVLYEALSGAPPFQAEDTFAVAYAHVNDPVPSLPNGARHWDPIIQRALAKNPKERYPTAQAFISALEDMARSDVPEGAPGRTSISRIFRRTNGQPRWWQFWRGKRREAHTEEIRPPLAIPSPFSRRLLARIRPWLPSFMRRPVWRVVQVVDEAVTAVTRRFRHARRRAGSPWVYLGGGAVLVALAGFVWLAAGGPMAGLGPDDGAGEPAPALATEAARPARDGGRDPAPPTGDAGGETQASLEPVRVPERTAVDTEVADDDEVPDDAGRADSEGAGAAPDQPVTPQPRGEDNGQAVDTLLAEASEALDDNRLTTPPGSNALELYERVLERNPGNERAMAGLREIVRKYLALSREALEEDAPRRSAVFLLRASEVVSSHGINSELETGLSEVRQATFDRLMASGRRARAQGEFSTAREEWALAGRLMPGSDAVSEELEALEASIADNGNGRFRDPMGGGEYGPEMTTIPSGRFEMGNDETGRATVTVAEPFAMSRREVTVAEFERFVEQSGYEGADHGCEVYENQWQYYEQFNWRSPGFPQQPDHPVVCVSWNDAQAYVAWLSVETGKGYRLPSEVEWEYALATGTEMDEVVCNYGNVGDMWLKGRFPREEAFDCADASYYTASVGSWAPNDYGLYDMVGNVREWTLDCWNRDHRGRPEGQGAWLSGVCGERVIKGSSWLTGKPGISPGHRLGEPVDAAYNAVGFRVVRELDGESG